MTDEENGTMGNKENLKEMMKLFDQDSKRKYNLQRDLIKLYESELRASTAKLTTISSDTSAMKTGIDSINSTMTDVGDMIDNKYHIFSGMMAYLISLMTGLFTITMVDSLSWSGAEKNAVSLFTVLITGIFLFMYVIKPNPVTKKRQK